MPTDDPQAAPTGNVPPSTGNVPPSTDPLRSSTRNLRTTAFSWILLAAAFSPVLIDLFDHWLEQPWAGYSVLFLPLFLLELRRAPPGMPRPRLGWALLAVALALELVLVAGGLTRAARSALVLGAVAIALLQGRPGLRSTALLVAFVPVPTFLVSLSSPALEGIWAGRAAGLLQAFGSAAIAETLQDFARLQMPHAELRLSNADGGLPLAALIVGLVWYAGCRKQEPILGTLLRALPCALLAIPLQILAITAAARVADLGGPARLALDVVPGVLVAGLGLGYIHRSPAKESLSSPVP